MKDEIPKDQTAEDQPKENEQTEITVADTISKNSRKHFKYRSNECLNCGHPLDLSDRYCPYCSQLNSTKQLSLGDFLREFLNSIVTYDSKLRYTIKDLLFKPGTITRNYVNGKRLTYANPFRFFLSISIIYFIVSTLIGTYLTDDRDTFNKNIAINNDEESYELDDDNIPNLNQINDTIKKYQALGKKKDSIKKKSRFRVSIKELDTMSWIDRNVEKLGTYVDFYNETEINDAKTALDSLGHENTKTNRWLYDKNKSFDKIKGDPYGFYLYLANKVPFFLFFFTPIFALFFWLFYLKKKVTYVEHVIFIFHIFSFIFLVSLIVLIPDSIIGTPVLRSILFLAIGPFYFYKALRNFYKQKRFITILKFIVLNFVFLLGASFIASIFFLLTAAAY